MPNLAVDGPSYGNTTAPAWSYCTVSKNGNYCSAIDTHGWEASFSQIPKDAPEMPTPATTWSNMTMHNQKYILQPPPLDIVWSGPAKTWSLTLGDGDGAGYGYFSNASIASTALCQPNTSYQWGFSSVLLFLFCCMTIVFAAVILLLKLDVYFNSRSNLYKQRRDNYRSAIELSQALTEEFGAKEVDEHPDDIGRRVRRHTGALSVATDDLLLPRRWQTGISGSLFRRRPSGRRQLQIGDDHDIAMYEPLGASRSAASSRKDGVEAYGFERG